MPSCRIVVLSLSLLLAAAGAGAGELEERGAALLERNCAGCHATGPADASPLAAAPPFRELKKNYPVETLAEPLAEGIIGGHPAMPERAFAPEEIDAILAYLGTL